MTMKYLLIAISILSIVSCKKNEQPPAAAASGSCSADSNVSTQDLLGTWYSYQDCCGSSCSSTDGYFETTFYAGGAITTIVPALSDTTTLVYSVNGKYISGVAQLSLSFNGSEDIEFQVTGDTLGLFTTNSPNCIGDTLWSYHTR